MTSTKAILSIVAIAFAVSAAPAFAGAKKKLNPGKKHHIVKAVTKNKK